MPLTSTFTYQGQLKNGGNAMNGSCQMAFRLYNDPSDKPTHPHASADRHSPATLRGSAKMPVLLFPIMSILEADLIDGPMAHRSGLFDRLRYFLTAGKYT
jgi:hypothetical protein